VGSWWGGKVRQVDRYLGARVALVERAALAAQLSPAQLALFDSMHVADQRHGLDVMAMLAMEGVADPEVLLAGLFHDAAKGPEVGLLHRVTWALGERYGGWVLAAGRLLPGFGDAYDRLRCHAAASADLALAAGCSARMAALIREQEHPVDPMGQRLLRADEAC
jgi:hypothetical protein